MADSSEREERCRLLSSLSILFVPWDRFPPFRPAARAIFLTELPRRGHRIDWLIQADEKYTGTGIEDIHNGVAYIGPTDSGTALFNRLRKHYLNFCNSCRALSLARTNQYDLIQAKDNFATAIVCLIAAKLNRVPFFYWAAYPRAEASIHEGKSGTSRYPFLHVIQGRISKVVLYKIILKAADHVFVQSEQMRLDFAEQGISVGAMTPVPSSVDLSSIPFDVQRESATLIEKGEREWVVYLGTLKRVRQLDFIIRAFSKVLVDRPNAILIIIGKGDQESDLQWLKDVVQNLDLTQSVVFTGFLDMADGWEYIRRADVCLSPYFPTPILQSTSPTKLVEYMAMGKPVVANDHPEQSRVISESGAGLCTSWDETAFAEAIVSLLASPELAAEMGMRGRAYVERYRTNQIMGDLVESTYRKVASRPR